MSDSRRDVPAIPSEGTRRFEFQVEPGREGCRLDVYLAGRPEAPGNSRAGVQRLIREGRVRIERGAGGPAGPAKAPPPGQVPKAGTALYAGDRILVTVPPPEPVEVAAEDIPLDVPYEDTHLIIINKPPGLVVHPAPGHARGTLVNALLSRVSDLAGIGGKLRPGIVHRLDKDTSGLMVVAKTEASMKGLQAALKARRIGRIYRALAGGGGRGGSFPDEGRIEGNIGRRPAHRKRMAVVDGGRPAVTHFRVLERFGKRALLEVRLETGRTHQIRVHLAHRGSPVIGDRVYGVRRKGDPAIDRQALHAYCLTFDHPVTDEPMRFEAPPPEDFQRALDELRGEGVKIPSKSAGVDP